MTKKTFWTLFLVLQLVFVFAKIYQHNRVLNLSYKKQRAETKERELLKEQDQLMVAIYHAKNQADVAKVAQTKLKLSPVPLAYIKTVSADSLHKEVA